MIVDLGNGIVLNPAHVVSVRRDYYENYLLISDVLGTVHEVRPKYGETIYDAEKRIISLLTEAPPKEGM